MYAPQCDGEENEECFDFACPPSHPVKMPEIHLYVRVLGYEVQLNVSQIAFTKVPVIELFEKFTIREEPMCSQTVLMCFTVTISLGGMRHSSREFWMAVKMILSLLTQLTFVAPG